MTRDFQIRNGIYLVQHPWDLDLHNDFDFQGLDYSVEDRVVRLNWLRSGREWVPPATPASVQVTFREVREFRFLPRDPVRPFSEDGRLGAFGYWTDDAWSGVRVLMDPSPEPDPGWLTALEFMSGAIVLVHAAAAEARVGE